jgi:hypothetical protein
LTDEDNVAARVAFEMRVRGWSQERLSKEMTNVGHPLHQTSISKIVTPRADGHRRAISVDEAMGFAKVFGVPLPSLLLPLEAVLDERIRVVLDEIHAATEVRDDADRRIRRLCDQLAALRAEATE